MGIFLNLKNAYGSRIGSAVIAKPYCSGTKMKVGHLRLERIGDNGKILRNDLVCELHGELINIDDFIQEYQVIEWDSEMKSILWNWLQEQHLFCEHCEAWYREQQFWNAEYRRAVRYLNHVR